MENVIRDTIDSLVQYMPRLIEGCRKVVEDIQSGDEGTALQSLPLVLEGINWVLEAIMGLKRLRQDITLDPKEVNAHLQEMQGALEIGDYVLLADLFEYELVEVFEQWLEFFKVKQQEESL